MPHEDHRQAEQGAAVNVELFRGKVRLVPLIWAVVSGVGIYYEHGVAVFRHRRRNRPRVCRGCAGKKMCRLGIVEWRHAQKITMQKRQDVRRVDALCPGRGVVGMLEEPGVHALREALAEIQGNCIGALIGRVGQVGVRESDRKLIRRGQRLTEDLRRASVRHAVGHEHRFEMVCGLRVSEGKGHRAGVVSVDMRDAPLVPVEYRLPPKYAGGVGGLLSGDRAGYGEDDEGILLDHGVNPV